MKRSVHSNLNATRRAQRRQSPKALTLALTFAGLLAAPTSWAQAPEAAAAPTDGAPVAADAAPTEGVEVPAVAARSTVSVHVAEPADSGGAPVANADVLLHIIVPPHQVLRTENGRTDDAGVATFDVEVLPGQEAVAEFNNGRRFFGEPIEIGDGGAYTTRVETIAETTDPSVVHATSVQTIVEPWEGYVAITQVWTLATEPGVIYTPDTSNPATLLRLTLPEGAEGIRVLQPTEQSRVIGTMVAFAAEVAPPELAEDGGGHVVLQFSLETHDQSDLAWSQTVPMDVDNFTVIVPQGSTFARHPVMDVELDGPRCGEVPADTFCFDYFGDDPGGLNLRDDVHMRVARGPATAGQSVTIETRGWPARHAWPKQAAALAALLGLLAAAGLFLRDRKRRPADPEALRRTSLSAQKDALFASAAELDRRLDDGLILQHEYDVAREGIRHQLGVIYRRMREMDAPATPAREASEAP